MAIIKQYYTGEPLFIYVPQVTLKNSNLHLEDGVYTVYELLDEETKELKKVFTGKVYVDPEWITSAERSAKVDIMPVIRNSVNPGLDTIYDFFDSQKPYFADTKTDKIFNHIFVVAFGEANSNGNILSDITTDNYMYYVHYNYTGRTRSDDTKYFDRPEYINTRYNDYLYYGDKVSIDYFVPAKNLYTTSQPEVVIWTYPNGELVPVSYNVSTTNYRLKIAINEYKVMNGKKMYPTHVLIRDKKYPILYCRPQDSVTLWFIANNGALDFIYCDLVCQRTVNANRTQMTKYATIANRKQFGKFNYSTEIYESYELNTQIMSDKLSKKMKNIFTSNYVWLQDSEGIMHSVVLTEKSLTIKKRQTHKIFNYTIHCEDSQTINLI